MVLDRLQLAAHHPQAANAVLELVAFRRVALRLDQADARVPAHVLLELRVVGAESAKSHGAHSGSAPFGTAVGQLKPLGDEVQERGERDRKAEPLGEAFVAGQGVDADQSPVASYSPPPLLPGLMAAVVCRMRN